MRLPKATENYDTTNEQQTRRALESAIDDIDGKLSSLLTSSGTLAANIQNLTVANGVNNNVALGYGTYTRLSGPTASFTLTGLTGGESGRVLLLRNTTAYDMTLSNDSGLSTAKNRILTQTGGNVTLSGTGGCSALLFYDGTSERWILVTGDPLDTRVTDLESRVTVLEADVAALEALFPISGGVLTYSGTVDGFVPVEQVFRLHAGLAGTNGTGAQSIFGVGCSLAASTVYQFEIVAGFSKGAAAAVSHQFALLFGGTATLNSIAYVVNNSGVAVLPGSAVAPLINMVTVATATNLTGAMSVATANHVRMTVHGVVSCNGAGTFIPQYQLTAAPGAYTTDANSYIRIRPIGASGANTNIGTWA